MEVVYRSGCDDTSGEIFREIENATGVQINDENYEEYFHNTDPLEYRWTAKNDSSIDAPGFELVSPPLQGERGLQVVSDVVRELDRYCSGHRSCGLHIHHEARDLTDEQFVNVYRIYYSLQPVLAFLVAPSRRYNGYCPPLNTPLRSWGTDPVEQKNELMCADRYSVNLRSYVVRGTIEFRQHHGTTSVEQILAWLFLTQRIVEYAREVKKPKEIREVRVNNMFRRLGWAGSALLDSRTRWTRAFWEERFLHYTRGALVAPVTVGRAS